MAATDGSTKGSGRATKPALWGTALLAFALGVTGAWGSSAADDEPFQFPKGTRWKYIGTTNGVKTAVTQEVFKVSQGDLFVKGERATVSHLLLRTVGDQFGGELESISTTGFIGIEGGYFVTGSVGGAPVRLYKLGSRPGDTWPCTDPRLKNMPDRTFVHVGIEKLTVPAGVFRSARHVRVELQQGGATHTGDFYIVPGIGIVKTEAVSEAAGRQFKVTLELESFTPPGEF
jgi:hypothetical protein